jgi:hypothetical protein
MAKLILLSVIIAAIAIPVNASKDVNPRAGLRKTLLRMALFNFFYLFAILYLYPRFL